MPDESAPSQSVVSTSKNFNFHKVFAAIGVILVVAIIVIGGVWAYVESQGGNKTDIEEDTVKISTSSTKTSTKSSWKNETMDWTTYSTIDGGFSLKYPKNLKKTSESDLKKYPNQGQFEVYFSSEDFTIIVDKWLGTNEKANANNEYKRIKGLEIGVAKKEGLVTSTRQIDGNINKLVGVSELTDRGVIATSDSQESRYSLDVYFNNDLEMYSISLWSNDDSDFQTGRKVLDLLLSTFKFL